MNVKDIRNQLIYNYKTKSFVTDKSGVKTVEIINANFIADEETIFAPLNHDYIEKELAWYLKKSLNVFDIDREPPKIWRDVADKFGNINSNYGWCIWSSTNFYQYESALEELRRNPDSRRAIMIYTRPSMQVEYNYQGKSDFICTNTVQYFIRDKKLITVVNMRSNDAIFGYRNDYAWQAYVQANLLCDLHDAGLEAVDLGPIHWNAGSLHIYERHFKYLEEEAK